MQAPVFKKIDIIQQKVLQLCEQNRKLTSKNTDTEQEVQKLKEQLAEQIAKTEELTNQIKIIKLARNINSVETEENAGVTELKRKINEYIREIDNCIAMLND